jgi:hypothetical protein
MKKLPLLILVAFLLAPGLLAQSLLAQSVLAQVTNLLKPSAPASVPTPADALGRDTPSGTVLGFLQAAQDGNERAAADYLQMSALRRQSQGPDMAGKLKALMDSSFVGSIRHISTQPEGISKTAQPISKLSDFSPTAIRTFPLSSSASPIPMPARSGFFPPTRSPGFPSSTTTSKPTR